MTKITKASNEKLLRIFTLLLFACPGLYVTTQILNSPVGYNYTYLFLIKPLLGLSSSEIFFSNFHFDIEIYRNIFSNVLFNTFGYSDAAWRTFPIIVLFLTVIVVYRFLTREIGELEAILFVLLFLVSYRVFTAVSHPRYALFYMFASFLTFLFLIRGFGGDGIKNWVAFAIINFLNLTNVFLAFLFLPCVAGVSIVCIIRQVQEYGAFTQAIKRRLIYFIFFFSLSLAMASVLYYLRGFNLLENISDILLSSKVKSSLLSFKLSQTLPSDLSYQSHFLKLFYGVFFTLNFDMVHFNAGGPIGHWTYFILFLAGLAGLYKEHSKFFWFFLPIFFIPVIIYPILFKSVAPRYLGFILPFYLITVSKGFVFFFSFVAKFVRSEFLKSGFILFSAFLVFPYLIQPEPFWSTKYIRKVFGTEGLKSLNMYLSENIKPSDIILNVTRSAELRGQIGDALMLANYKTYLDGFHEQHRLDLLPSRQGKTGVWLVLKKPLEIKKLKPFYFPGGYSPKFVISGYNYFLYYGTIELPSPYEIKQDDVFTSPFWLFMKARSLQLEGKDELSTAYYKKMIEHGLNVDRAYFNLGLIYFKKKDLKTALYYLLEAIKILETPMVVPENSVTKEHRILGTNDLGMHDFREENNIRLRYLIEKKNGIINRKWYLDDLVKNSLSEYSEYYLAAGITLFDVYTLTGNNLFFKEAENKFLKALEMNPNANWENNITYLLKNKPLNFMAELKFKSFDLMGIQDLFPALVVE